MANTDCFTFALLAVMSGVMCLSVYFFQVREKKSSYPKSCWTVFHNDSICM